MRLHAPSPPQGKDSGRSLLFSLLPPHVQYSPPQEFANGPVQVFDTMAYEPDGWADAGFLQRIPLTINVGQVPSTQTDFPLLINETFSELIGNAEAEIRIGSVNMLFPYEIESFNDITGELIAWAKSPSVSDSDVVYVYFDNPTAIDEQNSGLVWSDYRAVYHLNQTSFGSLSTIDSGPNNEDGTPQNMDATNQVAGKIDGSIEFDGGNEIIGMSNNAVLDPGTGPWTVSAWIISDSTSRMDIVGKQLSPSPFDGWAFRMNQTSGDGKMFVLIRENGVIGVRGTTVFSTGVRLHVVFTYDGSDNASGVRIFVDGVEETVTLDTDNLVGGVSTTVSLAIGNNNGDGGSGFSWDGNIDEVNISAVVKTPDFITTSFNNQDAPSTFYSTGTVESVPAPSDTMQYEDLDIMVYEE